MTSWHRSATTRYDALQPRLALDQRDEFEYVVREFVRPLERRKVSTGLRVSDQRELLITLHDLSPLPLPLPSPPFLQPPYALTPTFGSAYHTRFIIFSTQCLGGRLISRGYCEYPEGLSM